MIALILVLALLGTQLSTLMTGPAPVTGLWVTQDGKAIVDIAPCGDALCGEVAQTLIPDPSMAPTDVHNPDPRLRSRPIAGMDFMTGFVPSGDRWHGRIYDARTGRTYDSYLQAGDDGTLIVSGCVMIFCQHQTWERPH